MKKYFFYTIFCLCISCQASSVINEERDQYPNRCSLASNGIKEFPLDDETSYIALYQQLIYTDTITYFSFLNTHNNSIYFYDFHTSEFKRRISYQREGNHGVGNIQGYHYVNEDSIFVYAYWTQLLFLTDSKAEVIDKWKLYDETTEKVEIGHRIIYPVPYLQTSTPLQHIGNKLTMTGFIIGEYSDETPENRPTGILFNLNDYTIEHVVNYPEQYSKYNWAGGFTYRQPYYTLNDSSMAISFSADHYITEYSLHTGIQKRHYAGSREIKEIKPLQAPKGPRIDPEEEMTWYVYNSSYFSICYDKYKKLYYRLAHLPLIGDYKLGDKFRKPTVVIVLDADFKYVGEVRLPDNLYFEIATNCFVTEDGFYIQVTTDDENKMTFYCCNFLIDEK
ncbi:MAG: DUF4221 domain-containing protein [Prevotellaceae bacterium]|jgi:hypothetical protein|nr:DUF4221 domain-containing protein [Prevotellaceae bacterium]